MVRVCATARIAGENFSMQMRLIHQQMDMDVTTENFLEDNKMRRLPEYFDARYTDSPVRILSTPSTDTLRRRKKASSVHPRTASTASSSAMSRKSSAAPPKRYIAGSLKLKLLSEAVKGPHVDLFGEDRLVSSRLLTEDNAYADLMKRKKAHEEKYGVFGNFAATQASFDIDMKKEVNDFMGSWAHGNVPSQHLRDIFEEEDAVMRRIAYSQYRAKKFAAEAAAAAEEQKAQKLRREKIERARKNAAAAGV